MMYYFSTGVSPSNVTNFPYDYHKEIGNKVGQTLQIPFECEDVPENYKLDFLCDNMSAKHDYHIVKEVTGGNMKSKYAFFKPIN